MQGFVFMSFILISLFNVGFLVNKLIHFYMWAFFLFVFHNKCDQKILACDDADFLKSVQVSLAHFITLFRVVKEIPYLRNGLLGWSGDVLEPPSAVFSVCKTLYQKLVFFWNVYDSCTNCKFIDGTFWIFVQNFWLKKIWIIVKVSILESPEITVLLKKQMVWKILQNFVPTGIISVCVEIKQEIWIFLVWFYTIYWDRTYLLLDKLSV